MAENEKQTNKERLKDITDSIERGIQELLQSDKYAHYLRTMSRFHKYSVNNNVPLKLAGIYFIIAGAAVILTFVFRKIGKVKASIWTNIIALAYFVVVLTVNYLAGKIL